MIERALRLLESIPLVDGHNDLPIVVHRLADGDLRAFDPARVHDDADTDIPRLREGRVSAQFFAAFIPVGMENPAAFATRQIALIRQLERDYPETFTPGRTAADIPRAKREGRIASFITVENGSGLENRPETLEVWHEAGVRLLTLCHNATLDWVDSATDAPRHNGLSSLGREIVTECNRLGILVDCSHVSPKATHDVLDASAVPIVLSHSNVARLCRHPRNADDEIMARVAAQGGLVMATFIPRFTNQALQDWHLGPRTTPAPRATLPQVCDHIEDMVARIGIDHVGIGSDLHGGPMVDGLDNASRFPHLLAELMNRGWTDEAITKLASTNIIRVLSAVESHARSMMASAGRK
jgi:membrane dipeptidase